MRIVGAIQAPVEGAIRARKWTLAGVARIEYFFGFSFLA